MSSKWLRLDGANVSNLKSRKASPGAQKRKSAKTKTKKKTKKKQETRRLRTNNESILHKRFGLLAHTGDGEMVTRWDQLRGETASTRPGEFDHLSASARLRNLLSPVNPHDELASWISKVKLETDIEAERAVQHVPIDSTVLHHLEESLPAHLPHENASASAQAKSIVSRALRIHEDAEQLKRKMRHRNSLTEDGIYVSPSAVDAIPDRAERNGPSISDPSLLMEMRRAQMRPQMNDEVDEWLAENMEDILEDKEMGMDCSQIESEKTDLLSLEQSIIEEEMKKWQERSKCLDEDSSDSVQQDCSSVVDIDEIEPSKDACAGTMGALEEIDAILETTYNDDFDTTQHSDEPLNEIFVSDSPDDAAKPLDEIVEKHIVTNSDDNSYEEDAEYGDLNPLDPTSKAQSDEASLSLTTMAADKDETKVKECDIDEATCFKEAETEVRACDCDQEKVQIVEGVEANEVDKKHEDVVGTKYVLDQDSEDPAEDLEKPNHGTERPNEMLRSLDQHVEAKQPSLSIIHACLDLASVSSDVSAVVVSPSKPTPGTNTLPPIENSPVDSTHSPERSPSPSRPGDQAVLEYLAHRRVANLIRLWRSAASRNSQRTLGCSRVMQKAREATQRSIHFRAWTKLVRHNNVLSEQQQRRHGIDRLFSALSRNRSEEVEAAQTPTTMPPLRAQLRRKCSKEVKAGMRSPPGADPARTVEPTKSSSLQNEAILENMEDRHRIRKERRQAIQKRHQQKRLQELAEASKKRALRKEELLKEREKEKEEQAHARRIAEEQKQRRRALNAQKLRLARLHASRALLLHYGWRPWKSFMEMQGRATACAVRFAGTRRLVFSWTAWRASLGHRRKQRACRDVAAHGHWISRVLRASFKRWTVFIVEKIEQRRVLLEKRVFRQWQNGIKTQCVAEVHLEERCAKRRFVNQWKLALQIKLKQDLIKQHKSKMWSKVHQWLEEHENTT